MFTCSKQDKLLSLWALKEIPTDETGKRLGLRMHMYSDEPHLSGKAVIHIRVDGDVFYEGLEVEVEKGVVYWPAVLNEFIDALREGSFLRIRLNMEGGEKRTHVFPVVGFAQAYRWLAGACPVDGSRAK